jgi:putative aminopeptidase FrvX
MHSPSEVGSLADVEQTVEVLAEFLAALDEHFDPDPFRD